VAPYGYLLDPERPRDPSRLRLDPVKAAVVTQIFAWYTDHQTPASLYLVAKRLSDDQIPTPTSRRRWNVASVRGILRNPAYTGLAYSGRTRPAPARHRKSALRPVGPGASHQPAPPAEWIAIPVPAIVSQELFDAAQARLDQNTQMARRNNTAHAYLLRGLVSCAQCQLACTGRTVHPGYNYYLCRGRTDCLRAAQGERCHARYIPASALDELVWQDLCQILTQPALITHELERAHMGEWLPQALHARRRTIREALAQLERQQARLLEVYLAEVIGRSEFQRKRQEVTQTQHGLTHQLRQLDAQAQQQVDIGALAQGLETFCQRIRPTLDHLTFAQRRQLVELLIDRVIVSDGQVEIRYVVPTGPKGETTPFCHLRLDYFNRPTLAVTLRQLLGAGLPPRDVAQHMDFRVTIPCRLMQGDRNATQREGVTLGVDEAYLLFVDLPGSDGSLQCARAYQGALQLAVLAYHKAATARGNTKQKIHRAKVAIGDPQIVLFDEGQYLPQQRTFLCVPVFTQDDLGGQHLLLIQHHQNLAGQRCRPRPTQCLKAMCTGGEMIAIENLRAVSRHKRWQLGLQGTYHRGRLSRRIPDQLSRNAQFHMV
jgi:hypothetical protein